MVGKIVFDKEARRRKICMRGIRARDMQIYIYILGCTFRQNGIVIYLAFIWLFKERYRFRGQKQNEKILSS